MGTQNKILFQETIDKYKKTGQIKVENNQLEILEKDKDKRDEIILIAYVKFFEQKISMLGNLPKNLSEVFGKEMPKKEKKNGYQGAEFG